MLNMKKVLIAIPVYLEYPLHFEFTQETISSIESVHDYDFMIVINHIDEEMAGLVNLFRYPDGAGKTIIKENPKGNVLAASWNMAIDYGIEKSYDYILIPNNDILFHPKLIDNLIKFSQEHPDGAIWTASEYEDPNTLKDAELSDSFDEHPHFSCFMVGKNSLDALKDSESSEPYPGRFDENFIPAYFEDGDMHNRILRAGLKAYKTASAKFYHYGSRTIKIDDRLNRMNYHTYEQNREYFKKKWGWDPHGKVVANDDPIRYGDLHEKN